MKTRTDFVSNSSSTSFVIMGAYVDMDAMAEKYMEAHPDADADSVDGWDVREYFFGDMDCAGYGENTIAGASVREMKPDQTLRGFRDEVRERLAAKGMPDADVRLIHGVESDGELCDVNEIEVP